MLRPRPLLWPKRSLVDSYARILNFGAHSAHYVVHGDSADGMIVLVDYGQAAQIIFVEKLEDFFVLGIGRNRKQRLGSEFGHALFGVGQEQSAERDGAGESGIAIDEDYVINLVHADFMEADVVHDF